MTSWFYEKEALLNSPSIQDGIDYKTECFYRKEGAQLIKDICVEMDLPIKNTAATGVIYFHRFYMTHSFNAFPTYVTACCCLFLAGKVEETPKKCVNIIKTAKKLLDKTKFSTFGANPTEKVMVLEKVLLQTIKFDFKVQHPYKFLLRYVRYFKGEKKKISKMVQMAWIFINDSLNTTLPIQWEPEIIAIAVMHLAGKLNKLNLSEMFRKKIKTTWWDGFVEDFNKETVEDICHQILDIYVPFQNQNNNPIVNLNNLFNISTKPVSSNLKYDFGVLPFTKHIEVNNKLDFVKTETNLRSDLIHSGNVNTINEKNNLDLGINNKSVETKANHYLKDTKNILTDSKSFNNNLNNNYSYKNSNNNNITVINCGFNNNNNFTNNQHGRNISDNHRLNNSFNQSREQSFDRVHNSDNRFDYEENSYKKRKSFHERKTSSSDNNYTSPLENQNVNWKFCNRPHGSRSKTKYSRSYENRKSRDRPKRLINNNNIRNGNFTPNDSGFVSECWSPYSQKNTNIKFENDGGEEESWSEKNENETENSYKNNLSEEESWSPDNKKFKSQKILEIPGFDRFAKVDKSADKSWFPENKKLNDDKIKEIPGFEPWPRNEKSDDKSWSPEKNKLNNHKFTEIPGFDRFAKVERSNKKSWFPENKKLNNNKLKENPGFYPWTRNEQSDDKSWSPERNTLNDNKILEIPGFNRWAEVDKSCDRSWSPERFGNRNSNSENDRHDDESWYPKKFNREKNCGFNNESWSPMNRKLDYNQYDPRLKRRLSKY